MHAPEAGEIRDDDALTSDPDASAAPDGFDFGAAEDHPEETTTDRIARLDGVPGNRGNRKEAPPSKKAWEMVNADDKRLMKASL